MRHALVPISVTLLALASGCSTAPPKPSLMANMAKDEWTVAQLRAVDYEFSSRFGQLVAACATEVVEHTDDPKIHDRAYQWRMWAAPQARSAAFDQDPFAGLLELWVLAAQQRHYFGEGGGRGYFGDDARCVPQTTEYLEEKALQLLAEVVAADQLQRLTEVVSNWIEEHPIEGELFVRPTARADIASLVPQQSLGGLKAVGSMEDTLSDLNARLAILTVQMPAEARWQAEYLINGLFEDRISKPTDAIVGAAERVNDFLVEFEVTLAALTDTVMGGIQTERIAVFEAIEVERQMILSAVEQERVSVMDEIDRQVASATVEFDNVGRNMIDHFFVRLIEVLVVLGLVGFLTVLLVLFVVRRRDKSND